MHKLMARGQVQAKSPHLSASEKSPLDDKFYNLIILNFLILFIFNKKDILMKKNGKFRRT